MKFSAWTRIFRAEDLRNRLLITVALLLLYRLAAHVPVPGVDRAAIDALLSSQAGNFLSVLDLLSGGALQNFSVLAMGVYPYITAQIVLQLLVPVVPAWQRLMEEDPREGRKMIERYTYLLAIPMAFLNAFGQIQLFNNSAIGVVPLPNFGFTGDNLLPTLTTLITMTAGTMFAIWLGELISEHGIRNQGISLIIFAGIVAQLPNNLLSMWSDEQNRWLALAVFVVLLIAVVFVIVYVTQGRRNIPVMYPGRRMGYRESMPVRGKLPLLVNMSGMIPIIFAQALLAFPGLLAGVFAGSGNPAIRDFMLGVSNLFLNPQSWTYIITYFIMVVGFTYFYTDVIFQQQSYGESLKRMGAQVPGVTRGAPTQRYLQRVLRRITLPGALLLGLVAVLPTLAGLAFVNSTSVQQAFFFLGSGLLIVVGTVKETFFGIETELKTRGYDEGLLVR